MKMKVLSFLVLAIISLSASARVLDQEASVLSVGDSKSSKFSVSFFSIVSMANMKPGKSVSSLSQRLLDTYEYFSLNYKIDQDSKAGIHVPLIMGTEGINEYGDKKSARIALSDIHFVYSNYDLGYIGDFDLSGSTKIYLPSSPYSQASKTIAKVRFEIYLNWQFARSMSLEYVAKPDIYLQSQTAYFNPEDIPQYEDGTFMRDPRSTNKQFSLEHYAQLNFEMNRYFVFTAKTGFAEDWYYSSAAEQLEGFHNTKWRNGLSVVISPLKRVNFTLTIQNDSILSANRTGDVVFFQPENTSYSVMTNAFVF